MVIHVNRLLDDTPISNFLHYWRGVWEQREQTVPQQATRGDMVQREVSVHHSFYIVYIFIKCSMKIFQTNCNHPSLSLLAVPTITVDISFLQQPSCLVAFFASTASTWKGPSIVT